MPSADPRVSHPTPSDASPSGSADGTDPTLPDLAQADAYIQALLGSLHRQHRAASQQAAQEAAGQAVRIAELERRNAEQAEMIARLGEQLADRHPGIPEGQADQQ